MMHDWQSGVVSYTPRSPSGRPDTPWWTCAKCNTKVRSWAKPAPGMKIRAVHEERHGGVTRVMDNSLLTCEELIAKRVMDA